jgi:N-glycosylase/DNA lyase
VALRRGLKIQQVDKIAHIFHCSLDEYEAVWADYLNGAIECGFSLRILRQDLWEVTVSFIISQRNSVPRIKNTIEKFCALRGDVFPSPQILARCSDKFFPGMGLGYRARYLAEVARAVDGGTCDVEFVKTLSCEEAIKYLRRLDGVGEKVANCIALYGLHKLEAFPLDTWIRRVVKKQYEEISIPRPFRLMPESSSRTSFSPKGPWKSKILSEISRVIRNLICPEYREFLKSRSIYHCSIG